MYCKNNVIQVYFENLSVWFSMTRVYYFMVMKPSGWMIVTNAW